MKRVYVGDFRLGEDEKKAVLEVLDQGRISEGKKTKEFEKLWSKYIGTEYSVALNSGTSALIAGWKALSYMNDLPANKRKVITSPLTYVATSNALILAGYEPVFVDIDPKRFVITPSNINDHLKNSKDIDNYAAINPVHLMGYVADMDPINQSAKDYGLYVVEDSAQAHGSLYNGKKAGSMSLFSVFSFYIAHNIQAGEMGSLNTNDYALCKLVKKLKANGRLCDCPVCTRHDGKCPHSSLDNQDHDPRFTHDLVGYNFKTMEFQAALGISQVKKADAIFTKRQHNVKYYNDKLQKYSSLLQLPEFDENISYLAYPIVIKDTKALSRKHLRHALEKEGVENRPLFGCIPTQQPAYSFLKQSYQDKLPVADYVGKHGFYIGCHQYLTNEDLDYVVSVFDKILK